MAAPEDGNLEPIRIKPIPAITHEFMGIQSTADDDIMTLQVWLWAVDKTCAAVLVLNNMEETVQITGMYLGGHERELFMRKWMERNPNYTPLPYKSTFK